MTVASLLSSCPRVRVTTHLPLDGTRIGLTVWFGSVTRGWVGKPIDPRKWDRTWRIKTRQASAVTAEAPR